MARHLMGLPQNVITENDINCSLKPSDPQPWIFV